MNLVMLKGNLTKDPELFISKREGKEDLSITSFSLGCRDDVGNNEFIDCISFGKTADTIKKHFAKGQPIVFRGRIIIQRYTDKEGNNRTSVKVAVDSFEFCERKSQNTAAKEMLDEFMRIPDGTEGEGMPFN